VRRPLLLVLIVVGVILLSVVGAFLARVFSIDGAERAALTSLIQAEARGDQAGMIHLLHGCVDAPCHQRVADDTTQLRRPGHVQIILINSSAGFSLGSTIGTARVAWRAGGSLPVVQCVRVRRAGDVLSGLRVQLLHISVRIPSDSSCPPRY
jgi:hypothetical protein